MKVLALLLVLLLAAPVAVANTSEAPRVDVISTDEPFRLEGTLGAVRQSQSALTEAPTSMHLLLHAESLTVQNRTRGGFNELVSVSGDEEMETTRFQDATVIEHAARQGRDVSIHPIDATVILEDETGTFSPNSKSHVMASNNVVFDGKPLITPVHNSTEIQTTTPVVTVRGDFIVSLWEISVWIQGNHRGWDYFSGETDAPGVTNYTIEDGITAPGPSLSNSTEVYLIVHNGTLRMQRANGVFSLFVYDPILSLSSAELFGVSGKLPAQLGGTQVRGGDLRLAGDLTLQLGASAGQLSWDLEGQITNATLNGQPLAVVAPLPGGRAVRSWLPWATTALLLGIAAAGFVPLHRHNARRRLEDAELLFAAGHFEAAAAASRPRILSGVGASATAMRVQALLHAGHIEEARHLAARARITEPGLRDLVQLYVGDWEGTA